MTPQHVRAHIIIIQTHMLIFCVTMIMVGLTYTLPDHRLDAMIGGFFAILIIFVTATERIARAVHPKK
jgi:hypothetical protein